MKHRALPILLLLSLTAFWASAFEPKPDVTKPEPQKTEVNGQPFTLPTGFEIELVAGPPVVERPISAAFDDQGRLYVTEALGTSDKIEVQQEKKPYRIVRLEDSKGNGHFDKRTVFVDRIMFPEGALWYDGSLYVSSVPSIWKLTDTKGTGVADSQVEWFQGKTVTGCANDLHGPYLGPDGWIYWCKGAFAKQTYDRAGKSPFVTRAAHIFRSKPDGAGLEPVMTGGMDNPVGVAFTPGGERIFTTTFFQHPADGKRDGLVHAIYGGIYGKDHDVIYDHKWTSPAVMPVLTHLGPAAPCGLISYESKVLGADYQNSLFACLFNLHKVTRHILEPEGATFRTRDEDFLVSENVDFHPTDVREDADGSLLVVDTGGWYKVCCPTSQFTKPEVLGGIYRIRKKGAARVDDPRGLKLAWDQHSIKELTALLDDVRPVVRERAMQTLAKKGPNALQTLTQIIRASPSTDARRNAVWTATRIEGADARSAVRAALSDLEESVRQAALHSVSLNRDDGAVPALLKLLKNPSAHDKRAAAEALGRIGDKSAVPALLAAAGDTGDRVLEHSITYALIEIGDREGTAAGLKSDNVQTRRAALVALDQMNGAGLDAALVTPYLTSPTPKLKETAVWIVGRHPEWAGE
jgi:putative membrane-bound dehydrogenase-like protein